MAFIKQFFYRLKRLIQFIPHIWKGVDYDYKSAVDLFSYQLSRTANFLESNQSYSNAASQNANRIRTAVELLEKVYNEEYALEYIDQIEKIYGPNSFDVWFDVEENEEGSSYLRHVYEKWDNADEVEAKEHELRRASYDKQERAHSLVWRFIAHNIRYWFD
jgi:hypothetical protein